MNQEIISDQKVLLDDVNIERKAALLPDFLREDFCWLAVYTREECVGDIGLLTQKFNELHVGTDKSTWVRILKGHLFHNANGTPRDNPLVASDRFREEIDCLRKGVRLEGARGRVPFIMTTTARGIFDAIDLRARPDRVNKFLIIIGPTGSQKTASLVEYKRRTPHGTCTWLEAPENGSMSEFITCLAEAYGGPKREPYDRRRRRVFDSFSERKIIIVDNCQRLYRDNRGEDQPLFGFLQRLQDEKKGTIVLSITPAFEHTLTMGMMKGFFEQFEGRAGGRKNFLRLPGFAPQEDLVQIGEAFGLQQARRSVKYLEVISREPGRIRRLFEDLQDAKLLAEAERKPLTLSHLRAVREEEAVENEK